MMNTQQRPNQSISRQYYPANKPFYDDSAHGMRSVNVVSGVPLSSDTTQSNQIATSMHLDVFTQMLLSTSRDFPIPLEFSSAHSSRDSSLDSMNHNPRTLKGFHATLHSVDAFSSLLTQLPTAADPARQYDSDRNAEFDVASLIPPAPMDGSSSVVENACNFPYLSCDSIKPAASTNHAQPPTFQRKRRSERDWDEFLNAAYAHDDSDNESQSDAHSRPESPFDAEMASNSPQRHERSKVFSTLCHGLTLAPSTVPNGGWGVFATRFFNKNEHISCYDGALLDRSEAEARCIILTRVQLSNSFFLPFFRGDCV
jgi:hypothetical protein